MRAMFDWVNAVPASLVANVGALLLGAAVVRLYAFVSNRRLWSLNDENKVVVYVAESARTDVTKLAPSGVQPSGGAPIQVRYVRSATGVGQVRALAALAPSLRGAYRNLDLAKVRMAGEALGGDQRCDLISLGGVKNNRITATLVEGLDRDFELQALSGMDWVSWRDRLGNERSYTAHGRSTLVEQADGTVVEQRDITRDFGIMIKAPNPFDAKSTVIVFAGASTYGTTAAASYFVNQRRWRRPKYFQGLVEVAVADGHNAKPRCLELVRLRRRST